LAFGNGGLQGLFNELVEVGLLANVAPPAKKVKTDSALPACDL
jgi:hypothetical protein